MQAGWIKTLMKISESVVSALGQQARQTQGRHHQKSKTGVLLTVSVAPQKDMCLPKFLKQVTWAQHLHFWYLINCRMVLDSLVVTLGVRFGVVQKA